MNSPKKYNQQTSATTEVRNLGMIENKSGNIYKSLYIISRRAKQISGKVKEELHSKLEEFATHQDNLEEVFENREQIEISKYYERLPKPTLLAMDEFMKDKIYYRQQDEE